MRILSVVAALLLGIAVYCATASAKVNIQVDLATQTMRVTSTEGDTRVWPVSTGRQGYVTPRGTFGVASLQAMHYSRKYDNAPMPHSIFFRGGYAIHATNAVRALGRAASHGCIRLSPSHAAALYAMVRQEGARITVIDSAHGGTQMAKVQHRAPRPAMLMARRAIPGAPLAYAPMAPSFDDWVNAPGGLN